MLERLVYLLWAIPFVASLGLLVLVGIINALSLILQGEWLGVPEEFKISFGFPLLLWFRGVGIKHLHFKEHEDSLDNFGKAYGEEFGSNNYAARALLLAEAIEKSQGWERQLARQNAKAWLASLPKNTGHRHQETITLCERLFHYLLPENWEEKKAA